jgi:hypothetical protein
VSAEHSWLPRYRARNGHAHGSGGRRLPGRLAAPTARLRSTWSASGPCSPVVGELSRLVTATCHFAPASLLSWGFASQKFSSSRAVSGAHVPWMCPGCAPLLLTPASLDRSYVIQAMRILAVTWANATRGRSVFWLHAAVRTAIWPSVDDQLGVMPRASSDSSGYIFATQYRVSAAHIPFSSDTPT